MRCTRLVFIMKLNWSTKSTILNIIFSNSVWLGHIEWLLSFQSVWISYLLMKESNEATNELTNTKYKRFSDCAWLMLFLRNFQFCTLWRLWFESLCTTLEILSRFVGNELNKRGWKIDLIVTGTSSGFAFLKCRIQTTRYWFICVNESSPQCQNQNKFFTFIFGKW